MPGNVLYQIAMDESCEITNEPITLCMLGNFASSLMSSNGLYQVAMVDTNEPITLCMMGNFASFLLSAAFFQNQLFR